MTLRYLEGYPEEFQARIAALLASGELAANLARRYPDRHGLHSNKALFDFVQDLKARYLRHAAPLGKVAYDPRLEVLHQALGLHTTRTRSHGAKVRKRHEILVASVFKEGPPEFLRAVAVHELAHMKHSDHDRAFYALCRHMEPEYERLELDLRLWLTTRG